MFSLLRPRPARRPDPRESHRNSPSPGPATCRTSEPRHATADFTEADDDDDESNPAFDHFGDNVAGHERDSRRALPVLPLFSASHLDSLPIYSITHAIRIIIQTRTETTLTWEQIRSPQVSQFLVKPMQLQIRSQHFSRATLYALMANCLQFTKEGQLYPGNTGISGTRAKVCELLAMKLLKEYNTRELIDALSYDFYPLQGLPGLQTPPALRRSESRLQSLMSASRTSTLEVAIRASAKHFLAHPLVVQQLEAIWNGAISFYSAADRLHREMPSTPIRSRRGFGDPDVRTPLLGATKESPDDSFPGRRTVSLYDPRQASLFKLSRLRVPRYRSFLSTLSLAVLIGLFLAVLIRRSVQITSLELVFWFWSAGFMLDELVGFNEQGFSLYIMSFWNIFDLGILVLLIVYYCMRAYGVFLIDPHHWNDMAYDVLAANAILLLPRIFSVLDHYPYFSQLLIAFRLMAVDLAAVFVLVLISCSGFFVFFTLSKNQTDPADVAYKIFQILMGFTPAAWEVWPTYNWLGRGLLVLFLIICHFLVVTILITVLTNSFLAISSNATEEHQFLFAINTISMVKNDALFSYIAPGNIFAWLLMPLRFCMPLRYFVWLNRTVIKITHFPLLFCIFLYERYWLAPSMYEPTDLVENPGRSRDRAISFANPASRTAIFSPNVRVREESVAGFQKDRALEEVFRRTPDLATLRTQRRNERRKTQNAIRSWMDQNDEIGASPSNWPTVDRLRQGGRGASVGSDRTGKRRFSMGRDGPHRLRQVSDVRSAASDPADLFSNHGADYAHRFDPHPLRSEPEYNQHTDADGDDELVTNDEDEDEDVATTTVEDSQLLGNAGPTPRRGDYFSTPVASHFGMLASSSLDSSSRRSSIESPTAGASRRTLHNRAMSTNTILYNPQDFRQPPSPSSPEAASTPSQPLSGRNILVETPTTTGHRSPRRQLYMASSRARPMQSLKEAAHITPRHGLSALAIQQPRQRPTPPRRIPSMDTEGLSDMDLLVGTEEAAGAVPSSLQTQMAMAMARDNRLGLRYGAEGADPDRMGRLVLARMKTLEESFGDVLRGMEDLKSLTAPPTRRNSFTGGSSGLATIEIAGRDRKKRTKPESSSLQKKPSVRRPGSRRSVRESPVGMSRDKGKGKEIAKWSDSGAESNVQDRRGSSL